MLDQEQLETLLGRPLTSTEVTNIDTYLDIAVSRLSGMICFTPEVQGESPTVTARTFDSRSGYRTVFVDPFTTITSVTVDGNTRTDYVKKQNDSYNATWFNSIEFDEPLDGERVVITGTWGFPSALPNDLAQLLAGLFGMNETEVNMVKSKKIEDFQVIYKDGSKLEELASAHVGTIAKYAQCERAVLHGNVEPVSSY